MSSEKNDPIVLGVDPGFASFGWAIVRLSEVPAVLSAGVIRTRKATKLSRVLATEENVARAREIYQRLQLIVESQPSGYEVQAVCSEAMSWPRNAGAAAKVALAFGVLAAVVEERRLPLLQASPQHVKQVLCGKRDASKAEVERAVVSRTGGDVSAYSHAAKITALSAVAASGLPRGVHEHMYDAMATAIACADGDVVKLLRRAA